MALLDSAVEPRCCPNSAARRRLAVALLVGFAATAASAQGKIDEKLMRRYGGVLAPDCAGYTLPMLKYLGDSLVVQNGGKEVLVGRKLKTVPAYFGASPPPEFETAISSEVSGEAMVFVFYRTAAGVFVVVEGGPKVMAALPPALKGKRVRHCDPNRNAVPGAPVAVELGPTDLVKDPKFRRPYQDALGPLAKETWLMRLDGPAPQIKKVKVAGNDYQLVSVCKNHDCYENNLVLLWAPASQTLYGKVLDRGRPVLVGAPPPPVAAELERIWKAEYRRGG